MEVEEKGIGKPNEAFGSLLEAYPSFHQQRPKTWLGKCHVMLGTCGLFYTLLESSL
ncbi:hypothetical protein SLEP1_g22469 [Rubroshorea leprosula]|uniref:Uncharacterized protein n=1 Tax=Rubroshorea leprosula TaxID=152421 RepID=A0AAV5JIN5_9ROSI|nr:hypothetical protein SLEP1_g22469 [Rubroshorea leprosula]